MPATTGSPPRDAAGCLCAGMTMEGRFDHIGTCCKQLARGGLDSGRGSMPMKRTLIRYKTKPDSTQENQRLIESVFEELDAKSPDGVRYLVLRLDDGTFVHFVAIDPNVAVTSVPELEAFRLFQSGHK